MSFNKKLKALRLENMMTQETVARRLNVARSTIAGYETKNRQPSHENLTALADLFQVSVDYLLDDEDSIHPEPSPSPPDSDAERNLIRKYRALSPTSRRDVMEYIHMLELRDKERYRQAGS